MSLYSTSRLPQPRIANDRASPTSQQSFSATQRPLSGQSDEKSSAIADYVAKRNAAKANAEAIRKARLLDADRRRQEINSGPANINPGNSNPSANTSSQSVIDTRVPRHGIVTAVHSGSSTEASSASGSRRSSRGTDWSNHADAPNDSRGHDDEDNDDEETLNRFAKPSSSSYSKRSAQPQSQPQSRQPQSRPVSNTHATTGQQSLVDSLVARIAELESTVQSLTAQQRIFLSFMETTQQQLTFLQKQSQSQPQSQRSHSPLPPQHSPSKSMSRTQEVSRMPQSKQRPSSNRSHHHDDESSELVVEYRRPAQQQRQPTAKPKPAAVRGNEPPRQWDDHDDEGNNHDNSPQPQPPKSVRSSVTRQPQQQQQPQKRAPQPPQQSQLQHSQYEDEEEKGTISQYHSTSKSANTRQSQSSQKQSPPPPPPPSKSSFSTYDEDAINESMEDDPYAGLSTFPCPQCGRQFIETVLAKHVAKNLCQPKQRKVFDVRKQRLEEVQQELQKSGVKVASNAKPQKEQSDKQSKWRVERARLQEAIQAGKEITQAIKEGRPVSEIPLMQSSVPDDRVQCPHCGRKFADSTAERHIPHCKNSATRIKASSNTAAAKKR